MSSMSRHLRRLATERQSTGDQSATDKPAAPPEQGSKAQREQARLLARFGQLPPVTNTHATT
jgi:hypothetical protein